MNLTRTPYLVLFVFLGAIGITVAFAGPGGIVVGPSGTTIDGMPVLQTYQRGGSTNFNALANTCGVFTDCCIGTDLGFSPFECYQVNSSAAEVVGFSARLDFPSGKPNDGYSFTLIINDSPVPSKSCSILNDATTCSATDTTPVMLPVESSYYVEVVALNNPPVTTAQYVIDIQEG